MSKQSGNKTLMVGDFHAPLEVIRQYSEQDVMLAHNFAVAWKDMSIKQDLYSFLRKLGLRTPPKSWRTPIYFKEKL